MPALSNTRHERFYVYVVRINGRTRYVGKGCGSRYRIHLTRSHNGALASEVVAARASGESVRVRIVQRDMSESNALRLERRMIAKWDHRPVNVALGNLTAMENAAAACRADARMIKPEADVLREGSWGAVSLQDRLAVRETIIARLGSLEALALAA